MEKEGPASPLDYDCAYETEVTSANDRLCRKYKSRERRRRCESIFRKEGNRKLHCLRHGIKHGPYLHVVGVHVTAEGRYRDGAPTGRWLTWSPDRKLIAIGWPGDREIDCEMLSEQRRQCHGRAFEVERANPNISERQLRRALPSRCRVLLAR